MALQNYCKNGRLFKFIHYSGRVSDLGLGRNAGYLAGISLRRSVFELPTHTAPASSNNSKAKDKDVRYCITESIYQSLHPSTLMSVFTPINYGEVPKLYPSLLPFLLGLKSSDFQ